MQHASEKVSHIGVSKTDIVPLYQPEYFSLRKEINQLFARIENLESVTNYYFKKITLPLKSSIDMLLISDIVRCESDNNYCHIFLTDGSKILLSKTLKSIQHKINHTYFHRIHQSHLINQTHIRSIHKGSAPKVIMVDGEILPVSRNFNVKSILTTSKIRQYE